METLQTHIERAAGCAGGGPVLLVGPAREEVAGAEDGTRHRARAEDVLDADAGGHPRYALAVVVDTLEHLSRERGARLLATLRDLWAPRLLVAVPAASSGGWGLEDMLAHGLESRGEAMGPDGPLSLYGFDIDRYKRTPDWLNARNWANPELWGRHRW